jgi:hypothetical protein
LGYHLSARGEPLVGSSDRGVGYSLFRLIGASYGSAREACYSQGIDAGTANGAGGCRSSGSAASFLAYVDAPDRAAAEAAAAKAFNLDAEQRSQLAVQERG